MWTLAATSLLLLILLGNCQGFRWLGLDLGGLGLHLIVRAHDVKFLALEAAMGRLGGSIEEH